MTMNAATEHSAREVENRVIAAFRGLGYLQLACIDCHVADGTAYLRGEISSFYLKQIAQSVALNIRGVHQVKNQIQVQDSYEQFVG